MASDSVTAGINAGPRLDRLPVCSFHWRILALIGAGMFLDAFDIYLGGGVLGALVKSGWSTLSLNASFVTSTFLGMVVGAWCAGILGDRYGRRFTYQFNLALFGLFSLAAAAAPDMYWLIAFRFVIGIGLGAEIVVGYATLAEFVPAAQRGRWVGMLAVITNLALFGASLLGLWIIPRFSWRAMFVLVGIAALGVWFARKSMPESPRWLEAQGRGAEAEAILQRIEAEAARAAPLPPIPAQPAISIQAPPGLAVLFSPAVIRRTLLGMMLHVVVGFSLYGFISWLPTFFVQHGFSVASSLGYTTLMSMGGPLGALVGLYLADGMGRRWGIVLSSLLAAAFGVLYPMVGDGWPLMLTGFLMVTSIYTFVTVGFAIYVPELFPTLYRFRGTGTCATVGRLATASVQFVVVAAFSYGGLPAVLGLLVTCLLVQAVVVALFGIETRRQTLESLDPGTPLAPALR